MVCSGQWGGQAPETYERTGRTLDLMYLGGGGIHGHPQGPAAGVRAIRQAWAAAEAGVPLATWAATTPSLPPRWRSSARSRETRPFGGTRDPLPSRCEKPTGPSFVC